MGFDTALSIGGASTRTAVVAATPVSVVIPNSDAGIKAKYILLVADGVIAFRPIQTGETPALSTMVRLAGPGDHLVLNVTGYAALRMDADAGTVNVTITPLDNM